jgi:F-type H+-transporting ATPase subunit gamma
MASARDIKKRIRSVKNISQITRALEAVSASRVRKAQARVLASRAYAQKAWEILLNVQSTATKGIPLHPLLSARTEVNNIIVVLITSDRGLAGAFNSNILRVAQRFSQRLGKPARFIAVGKKGRDSLVRVGANLMAEFTGMKADPTIADLRPVARLVIDEFLSGKADQVFIAYTDFINTLTQKPVVLSWLPLIPYQSNDELMGDMLKAVPAVSAGKSDYEYEPNATAILDEIVPRFTELQLYQALLESQASEHSARMVAMRNASDNATTLIGDLTLMYNKARQAAITAEILDIVGGAEALQDSIDKSTEDILKVMTTSANGHKASSNGHAAVPVPVTPRASRKSSERDDLKKIEGIGPKMEEALHAVGIDTFEKLASAPLDALKAAVDAAGLLTMATRNGIETWSKQSALAAQDAWDDLKAYQDKLVGGREIN